MLISLGARAADATPQRIETTWQAFVEWVYQHPRIQADVTPDEYQRLKSYPTKSPEGRRIHEDKDGSYVVLADFGGNRREYASLLHSSGIPLDFDSGTIGASTIAATLHGTQYVAFTTYAHQPGAERWRVFVPSARPMTAEEHTAAWFELSALFGNAADPAAKDATRLSYLPGRCLLPAQALIFHSFDGPLYQPPRVAPAPPAVLQTQVAPVPGWSGPTDDVELLTIACNTRTRPDERFGGPIHFAMLWSANPEWLATRFPSSSQPWDYTQADMALAGELIYYTGRDVERSLSLLRQSGLAKARQGDEDWHDRKAVLAVERAAANAKQYHFMGKVPEAPPAPQESTVPLGTPDVTASPVLTEAQAAVIANIPSGQGTSLNDYFAFLPDHTYIHRPSGERISAASVDEQIGKEARSVLVPTVPVHKYTWAPGMPERFTLDTLDPTYARGSEVWLYNDYRAPKPHTQAGDVSCWLELITRLYPDDVDHLVNYFADAVQNPSKKCNHAVVLGSGVHGIGKDTLLAPVAYAVGRNNFRAIKPTALASEFNPWVRAVVVQISESRDLGEGFNSLSRYEFYERCKDLAAAPPATLECNDKHMKQMPVANVLRLVITTNHQVDGLHIDPKDRRHYCAWSDAPAMTEDESKAIWEWYEYGSGLQHVAQYLVTLDLGERSWNRSAAPKRTAWWQQLVAGGTSSEEERFADALEKLQRPEWVTTAMIAEASQGPQGGILQAWIADPKNSRKLEREMVKSGYQRLPNPQESRGRWTFNGQRIAIYRRSDVSSAKLLGLFGIESPVYR